MKNYHLIDWAISEILQASPRRVAPSAFEPKATTQELHTNAIVGGSAETAEVEHGWTDANIESEGPTSFSISDDAMRPDSNPALILLEAPASAPASADFQSDLASDLRKAIVSPNFATSQATRDRAIELRWALRDIKSNRLKLLPMKEDDLRDLISVGLVEMSDNEPILTEAGAAAIG
jgi:hypothetical protein